MSCSGCQDQLAGHHDEWPGNLQRHERRATALARAHSLIATPARITSTQCAGCASPAQLTWARDGLVCVADLLVLNKQVWASWMPAAHSIRCFWPTFCNWALSHWAGLPHIKLKCAQAMATRWTGAVICLIRRTGEQGADVNIKPHDQPGFHAGNWRHLCTWAHTVIGQYGVFTESI